MLLLSAALAAIVGATITRPAPASGAVNVNAPGSGFTVSAGDLAFILKQIKIAERHAATVDSPTPVPGTVPGPCAGLLNQPADNIPDAEQVPDTLTSYGLRTVDGSCNNLIAGRQHYAASDQVFPRDTDPLFRDAEANPPLFGPPTPTSYSQKKGDVFDSQPRVISNLIVDQTSTNPAAIAAAQFPVRTQGNAGICDELPSPANPAGVPAGCLPDHKTLFIPNVTTDVGLSPPFNSLFTFFGQFFDHGVDQTVKSGATVFIPLKNDDPLIAGPDHVLGAPGCADTHPPTCDDLPSSQRFMVLTRARNQPGPDGVVGDDPATPQDESADDIQNASNTDTPLVDQSQTYTSHSSHQVFLREYVSAPAGRDGIAGNADDNGPVDTGKLLGGLAAGATYPGSPDGTTGMATWASVKKQARELMGLRLVDTDVTNIPMLAADPYGNFLPGPHGLPQYVTKDHGLVEGALDDPATTVDETVPVPPDVLHFDTPFLTDIAHNADPTPVDTDHNPATPPDALKPDGDEVPSADFANQPAGTYDDEMLNAHFCAGDGRVNENIALTTVHQIFHSEHDRLVADIRNTLEKTAAGQVQLADWQKTTGPAHWNYEQRLFQAARFVTEMEYQHLVFEEFARKLVPAIRPFHLYHSDLNPVIPAEFAHAVYRFGHSMLDDDVARSNEDPATGAKTDNSLPLLTAFLNPPEYFDSNVHDPAAPAYTPEQAAGALIMGSSDQVGNEIDEFVTDTLRNNLLGLPLDLPTINMTRAREAGIPPLNVVRKQLFATTHDAQLTPYANWSDYGQHLKHPESLINYVAAYGTHRTITSATTVADKRAAAKLIVDPAPGTDPTTIPNDAADFMFSTGAYADVDGKSQTGLDDVDLWVGGLGELTEINGGLLGSTFNYVFQHALESLQDGDRLYYLARTPGLNLRTQLEANSFSELIQRNTAGTHTLKADAFATADCKFELGNLTSFPATAATATITGAGSLDDDLLSECNENKLLLRQSDGTIQYRTRNTVDPTGINGQGVYNGTANQDRVKGGVDNDTFWGGDGRDVIDGQGGDDVVLGGNGDDLIADLAGADVLKGGPGNDAIDGGSGDDLNLGGDGKDFTLGGTNDNETFAGEGDDFVNAGEGADAVFGDGGDDWIQGGSGQDLLQGDHGAPFFDDPGEATPGHDVFVGQVGENDYDAEGGDDLMAQNSAVDRNAGGGGFDWAFHQYDTVGGDDDMMINQMLVDVPIQLVVNRDRWQETEADSGSAFNDVIRGDDTEPGTVVGGAGFAGCDALDPGGVARIKDLNALVTTFPTPLSAVEAASVTGICPLDGDPTTPAHDGNVWAEGNILLGGGGSDTITGRGGNDIIDGDKSVKVSISVRDPNNHATEIGSTDLMEHRYLTDASGQPTGPTLQDAVFRGDVDPADLEITREIVDAPTGDTGVDTAVFLGNRVDYLITLAADGSMTVEQTGALGPAQKVSDGKDTLRHIERLQFADGPFVPAGSAALAPLGLAFPTAQQVGSTSTAVTATLSNTGLLPLHISAVTLAGANPGDFAISGSTCGTPPATLQAGSTCNISVTFTPTAGGARAAVLRVTDDAGGTAGSTQEVTVSGTGSTTPAPNNPPTGLPLLSDSTPQVGQTLTAVTSNIKDLDGLGAFSFQWFQTGVANATFTAITGATSATLNVPLGGVNRMYRVRVTYTDGAGHVEVLTSANSARTTLQPNTTGRLNPTVSSAPGIGAVARGPAGNPVTASVNWTAPADNGGVAITGYKVSALRFAANGTVASTTAFNAGANARTLSMTLTAGATYRFEVRATNSVGDSAPSVRSGTVVPR